jgi:hypothetical protein
MDLASLIVLAVNLTFSDSRWYTAADRTAIIGFFANTVIPDLIPASANILNVELTGSQAALPEGTDLRGVGIAPATGAGAMVAVAKALFARSLRSSGSIRPRRSSVP